MTDESKLRMAARSPAEQLQRELERDRRTVETRREFELEDSLAPFRVGSVPYLNAVPLTRGLEKEILFVPPSQLGRMLANRELDAALLSISEALFSEQYEILDGAAIASLGEVFSVFLSHLVRIDVVYDVYF
jgi:hypothetical protein